MGKREDIDVFCNWNKGSPLFRIIMNERLDSISISTLNVTSRRLCGVRYLKFRLNNDVGRNFSQRGSVNCSFSADALYADERELRRSVYAYYTRMTPASCQHR